MQKSTLIGPGAPLATKQPSYVTLTPFHYRPLHASEVVVVSFPPGEKRLAAPPTCSVRPAEQLLPASVTARLPRWVVGLCCAVRCGQHKRPDEAYIVAPCCSALGGERKFGSEGGGKMKAEINEVSGVFLLPGHRAAEWRPPSTLPPLTFWHV